MSRGGAHLEHWASVGSEVHWTGRRSARRHTCARLVQEAAVLRAETNRSVQRKFSMPCIPLRCARHIDLPPRGKGQMYRHLESGTMAVMLVQRPDGHPAAIRPLQVSKMTFDRGFSCAAEPSKPWKSNWATICMRLPLSRISTIKVHPNSEQRLDPDQDIRSSVSPIAIHGTQDSNPVAYFL